MKKLTNTQKNIITASVFILGAAFVVIGIYRDEVQTVLTKAVNICLECIGIG